VWVVNPALVIYSVKQKMPECPVKTFVLTAGFHISEDTQCLKKIDLDHSDPFTLKVSGSWQELFIRPDKMTPSFLVETRCQNAPGKSQ